MRTVRAALALLFAAGCVRYQAAPVDPTSEVSAYGARSLAAPDLGRYLDSLNPAPPGGRRWQPADLALAAVYFRASSDRQRREIEVARAAEVAAGGRPQPGLETQFEIDFAGRDGSDPWAAAITAIFPVERGGKRAARLGRARAGTLATIAAAMMERWALGQDTRLDVLDLATASTTADLTRQEAEAIDSAVALLETRYREGAISVSEVARVRAEARQARARLAGADRALEGAWARLAQTLAVPLGGLRGLELPLWKPGDQSAGCGVALGAPRDSLGLVAVSRRWEIRRALAEYQEAEADLRLAVAASWPDLAIGPGLFFDHGVGKWLVNFALPTIAFNRNRGPIGEAEARRGWAAARLREAQEAVLAEVEVGRAACAASSRTITEAVASDSAIARQRELAEAAWRRGETGRLELALLAVEQARARALVWDATAAEARASLAVERALGVWLNDPPAQWPGLGTEGVTR